MMIAVQRKGKEKKFPAHTPAKASRIKKGADNRPFT